MTSTIEPIIRPVHPWEVMYKVHNFSILSVRYPSFTVRWSVFWDVLRSIFKGRSTSLALPLCQFNNCDLNSSYAFVSPWTWDVDGSYSTRFFCRKHAFLSPMGHIERAAANADPEMHFWQVYRIEDYIVFEVMKS